MTISLELSRQKWTRFDINSIGRFANTFIVQSCVPYSHFKAFRSRSGSHLIKRISHLYSDTISHKHT